MPRDLLIRGIDDDTHSKLGDLSNEMGVSINSIVKDAVDKWMEQQSRIPKKHDLIIYADDDSLLSLLRSMDRLAKEGDWFRSFCGPPSHTGVKLLTKLDWFDGTVKPYKMQQKEMGKYCGRVMERIVKGSDRRLVCCMDFLISDIAQNSLKQALDIEHLYDSNRIPGLMFCPYRMETLLNAGINDMMDLFLGHDQIFVLKNGEIYKLHVTRENVHKLFLH